MASSENDAAAYGATAAAHDDAPPAAATGARANRRWSVAAYCIATTTAGYANQSTAYAVLRGA